MSDGFERARRRYEDDDGDDTKQQCERCFVASVLEEDDCLCKMCKDELEAEAWWHDHPDGI